MTYCSSIGKPLLKKIKAGKSLDEIGAELCGDSVKNPRKKAVRLIRELLGEDTLVENAGTLGYDVTMANLSKKRNTGTQRKSAAENTQDDTPHCSPSEEQGITVTQAVRVVVNRYGYNPVAEALTALRLETPPAKEITETMAR